MDQQIFRELSKLAEAFKAKGSEVNIYKMDQKMMDAIKNNEITVTETKPKKKKKKRSRKIVVIDENDVD